VRDEQNGNTPRGERRGEKLRGRKSLQSRNEISEQILDVYASDLQHDAQHARTRPPIRIKARVRQVLQSYENKVLSKS